MPNDQYLSELREEIADAGTSFAAEEPSAAFYIFFSFDLVNSTLYKTLNPTRWPVVTRKFYELIEDGLQKHMPNVRLWKYVGDELFVISADTSSVGYERMRSKGRPGPAQDY